MHEVYEQLRNYLPNINRPVVFEFGVNEAQDTKEILKLNNNIDYYGFEPDPMHFNKCKEMNLPIKLFNYAIGEKDESGILYQSLVGQENTGSSSIRKPKNVLKEWPLIKFDNKVDIIIRSFDSLIKELKIDRIDFIWADIQGAEIDLLKGGQEAFKKVKMFFTEYSYGELYEGQIGLKEIHSLLPGKWRLIKDYISDALFINEELI